MDQISTDFLDKIKEIKKCAESISESLSGLSVHIDVGLNYYGDIPYTKLEERHRGLFKNLITTIKDIKHTSEILNTFDVDFAINVCDEIELNALKRLDNDDIHVRRNIYKRKCENASKMIEESISLVEISWKSFSDEFPEKNILDSKGLYRYFFKREASLRQMLSAIYYETQERVEFKMIPFEYLLFVINQTIMRVFPSDSGAKSEMYLQDSLFESGVAESRLKWKGDKNDLVELIWALSKSELIFDEASGRPAAQKKIIEVFSSMLNIDLSNFHNLFRSSLQTYQRSDGKLFTANLMQMVQKEREAKSKNK